MQGSSRDQSAGDQIIPNEMTTDLNSPREWKVYFERGFWALEDPDESNELKNSDNSYDGKTACDEIKVAKEITWGASVCHIPAVYCCKDGLVVDTILELSDSGLNPFDPPESQSAGRHGTPACLCDRNNRHIHAIRQRSK